MTISNSDHEFTAEGVPCPKCGVHLEDREAGAPCDGGAFPLASLPGVSSAATMLGAAAIVAAFIFTLVPFIQKAGVALSPPLGAIIEHNADTRIRTE